MSYSCTVEHFSRGSSQHLSSYTTYIEQNIKTFIPKKIICKIQNMHKEPLQILSCPGSAPKNIFFLFLKICEDR